MKKTYFDAEYNVPDVDDEDEDEIDDDWDEEDEEENTEKFWRTRDFWIAIIVMAALIYLRFDP